MESIQNEYGRVEWGLSSNGKDYTYQVYDENGNIVVDRQAAREKLSQICRENHRQIEILLIDLMTGNCPNLDVGLIKEILECLGIPLYNNDNSMRGFYEVFENIAFILSLYKDR